MSVPGVHTLAKAELGTRPSSVMHRPWRRARRHRERVPPPRGTPVVHADARDLVPPTRTLERATRRLSAVGWAFLIAIQLFSATVAGTLYLLAT